MEKYEPVMIEVIRFESEDIITTSGNDLTTGILWEETNN